MTEPAAVHYIGGEAGLTRRPLDPAVLDQPWVLRALGGHGVIVGTELMDTGAGRPWCAATLEAPDSPLGVLVVRRRPGGHSFGRRDVVLATGLLRQAESWLSIAELAARRARPTSGDAGEHPRTRVATTPSLATLRESTLRLSRLAETGGNHAVADMVGELAVVERAVASLVGTVAGPEPDPRAAAAADHEPVPFADPRADHEWTTTGVMA